MDASDSSRVERFQEVGACPTCRGALASDAARPATLACKTCGFIADNESGVVRAMVSGSHDSEVPSGSRQRSDGWAQGIADDMDGKAGTYGVKYRSYTIESRGFILRRRHALDLIGIQPGRTLEAGCGPGILGPLLSSRGLDVHGVDLSLGQLEVAARGDPETLYVWADLERLPYIDGVFDCVVALGVLEYVERPKDVLRELARVTATRGQLVVSVPNRQALPRLWTQFVWIPVSRALKRALGRSVPSYSRRLFSLSGVAADLCSAGFQFQEARLFELCLTPPPLDRILQDRAVRLSETAERQTRGLLRRALSNQIVVRATRAGAPESRS
jgi:2-polyprenyl-3-methyl-5-hydroxy-6-metoxy-1,4-benzoquinol methylase